MELQPNVVRLFVDPESQASAWRDAVAHDPGVAAQAALIAKIASQPQAMWVHDEESLERLEQRAPGFSRDQLIVVVVYLIPHRDAPTRRSSGGAHSTAQYRTWVDAVADALSACSTLIVLEPDALASISNLRPSKQDERIALLRYAVTRLSALPAARVYVDAGHPRWLSAGEAAARLRSLSLSDRVGFALNVANFVSTPENIAYGQGVSRLLGGATFVIDTSRNGNGPRMKLDGSLDWCNPPGRALGEAPQLEPHSSVDAFLWIKRPGESDGRCHGGPPAGEFWPKYAFGLVERADRGRSARLTGR